MAVRHPSKVIIRVRISLAALFYLTMELNLSHLGLKTCNFFETDLSHFCRFLVKRTFADIHFNLLYFFVSFKC